MAEEPVNVAEEIKAEEAVPPQENSPAPVVEEQSQKTSSLDENFKRLRETKEHLERENRELKQWVHNQQKPAEEEGLAVEDDDLVEGKVVKQLYNEIKELKKFRRAYDQEKLDSIPSRLKSKFDDFDQVVTQENIEKLKLSEPELYASITSGSDLYAKGVSAYKMLKNLGIVKENLYEETKEQVRVNQTKPLSAQAIKGQGALAEANIFAKGLTPELKKQLQQEMVEAAKGQ